MNSGCLGCLGYLFCGQRGEDLLLGDGFRAKARKRSLRERKRQLLLTVNRFDTVLVAYFFFFLVEGTAFSSDYNNLFWIPIQISSHFSACF